MQHSLHLHLHFIAHVLYPFFVLFYAFGTWI